MTPRQALKILTRKLIDALDKLETRMDENDLKNMEATKRMDLRLTKLENAMKNLLQHQKKK